MSGRPLAAALLAALALTSPALASCVAPAPTTSAYEGKAVRTASDALSQVETARMAVRAAAGGRMTRAYLEVVLTDAEDAFGSIQNTFDSVQPPDDPVADRLRDSLDSLLSGGADALGQVRIAARRNDTATAAGATASLGRVAEGLDRFTQEHPA